MNPINNRFWSTWTSFFLLFPVIVALIQNKINFAILVTLLMLASILYHLKKTSGVDWWWHRKKFYQHFWQILDTGLGIAVGVVMFQKVLETKMSLALIFLLLFVLIDFIYLFISNKYYEACHGLWHILSGITIFLWLFI